MRASAFVLLCLAACGSSEQLDQPNQPLPPSPPGQPDAAGVPDAGPGMPDAAIPAPGDILTELQQIPGMTVSEGTSTVAGYRLFNLTYDQPVDHRNPAGARFQQRLTLIHRSYAAPMVSYNSGYFVSSRSSRSELTIMTNANQLSMEYRFFEPSRPSPADWSKLDIEQAANDQHRVILAFKAKLYRGRWLSTGASKGGMTSLFHRRFFPSDVDATVAYVAPFDYPADAVQGPTNRYIRFLDTVGTDAACRQKLKDFQNLALARRTAMKTSMRTVATYTAILGEDRALEFAVEELPFVFWQYGSQANCTRIPVAGATDAAVFKFLNDTVSMAAYGDADLTNYLPYYHQSATQLGYPISDESYLVGLLHPGKNQPPAYIPASVFTPAYDNGAAMTDVQGWIKASGARILLVYGQSDPWTAGEVELGGATDSLKFFAPGGNHGSKIASLNAADRAAAQAAVARWAGVTLVAKAPVPGVPEERTAEDEDLELARLHRLR